MPIFYSSQVFIGHYSLDRNLFLCNYILGGRVMNELNKWIKANKTWTWLAGELGITKQAVGIWQTVPQRHLLNVSRLTGISVYTLNPEAYIKCAEIVHSFDHNRKHEDTFILSSGMH